MKNKKMIKMQIDEENVASYNDYSKMIDEQNEIKKYIIEKNLSRPKTNIFTLLMIVSIYVLIAFVCSYFTVLIFNIVDYIGWIYVFYYAFGFFMIAKLLCIKSVECYQHYAKEDIRRRCLCQPTCSEYALEVLKRYFLFVLILLY